MDTAATFDSANLLTTELAVVAPAVEPATTGNISGLVKGNYYNARVLAQNAAGWGTVYGVMDGKVLALGAPSPVTTTGSCHPLHRVHTLAPGPCRVCPLLRRDAHACTNVHACAHAAVIRLTDAHT